VDTNGQKIKVTLDDGQTITCFVETQVKNIIKKFKLPGNELSYIGALVNNEMVSLTYPLEVDSNIKLLTFENSCGWRIYKNSLTFLLTKAAYACFPDINLEICHTIGNGLYCTFDKLPNSMKLSDAVVLLDNYIRGLVEAKIPIIRRKLYLESALKYFAKIGRIDKTKLLHFTNDTKIVVYQCEKYFDLAYENVLCNNTEALKYFKLFTYDKHGFILQFPERKLPVTVTDFKRLPNLFSIFKHYKRWGETIGIRTVGDLNEVIVRGNFRRLIRIEEAYQEKRIAEITDRISMLKNKVKWVLIAGPSSSGKTTFAHRLGTQIRVNGIIPVVISVDNYFRNREETPLDEYGNYDFEHIDTIDLKLLNEHLTLLDQGKEIEIPVFDFKKGKRGWSGRKMSLGKNEIAVIEGIHSLNPKMTESLNKESKFCIYINALTQLNLDVNHRVSTTDNRLIRRIVRDHRTRGNRALATLDMWSSVRKGEKKWIFPFQEKADCIFSSAVNYELSVLKPYVEPLLAEVKPWHSQYVVARRLQHFMKNFMPAEKVFVPHNSLIREFVGEGIIEEKSSFF
jgi:uridine kinase